MNIRLTEAEIGEAMRRLAIRDKQTPRKENRGGDYSSCPVVAERRKLAQELRDDGLPLALVLAQLYRRGYKISMATLKHDVNMALE